MKTFEEISFFNALFTTYCIPNNIRDHFCEIMVSLQLILGSSSPFSGQTDNLEARFYGGVDSPRDDNLSVKADAFKVCLFIRRF